MRIVAAYGKFNPRLTIKEVAEMLRVSVARVKELIMKQLLRSDPVGNGKHCIFLHEVERFRKAFPSVLPSVL